jgi:hypothetical protein
MNMMTVLRSALGLATIAGATMAVGVTAEARSVPGFTGQAQNPGLATCFTNSNGRVTNVCSSQETYCVPMASDGAAHTVEITMYAPNLSNNISCTAVATNPQGGMVGTTGPGSPGTVGEDVSVTLVPSLSVPSEGGMYACCSMMPGTRIDTLNY